MDKGASVELKHFSQNHLAVLRTFELPVEQEQYTSLPLAVLDVVEGQHRIVITYEEEPVGFFILHATDRVKEYSPNSQAMLLTSFSINHAKQGRGYAKQGMLLLQDFVKAEFPACDEIVLAVNHKNIPAQRLYEKVGFVDTDRRKMGPKGEQFIFSLQVPNA